MADPVTATLLISSAVGLGTSLHAQKASQNAADAAAKSQQNALERRKENQRQALIENTRRQERNKQRQLAQVRASQAASGFNTESGTPLAIFGDIESRLDEQVDESTSRGLDGISATNSQIDNIEFSDSLRDSAGRQERFAIGIGAVTKFSGDLTKNHDRTGFNPFGIFN